jgi:OmpA-OmpF porin, OOP family
MNLRSPKNHPMRKDIRPVRAILLFAVSLLATATTFAQGDIGYFRQGEKLFLQKNYYEAKQYYEKFLSSKNARVSAQPFAIEKKVHGTKGSDPRQEATYHLAECLRQTHDYVRAEKYYQKSLSFPVAAYPEDRYWYGVCLRTNGKYEEAIAAFTEFEKEYHDLGPVLADADRELESLRFIRAQLTSKNTGFFLSRFTDDVRTSSYALSFQRGDTAVFTGIRIIDSGTKNNRTVYRNDLYSTASIETAGAVTARLLPMGQEPDLQNGLASFSSDGKKMFFTRWTKNQGGTQAAIWSCDRSDSGWSKPLLVDVPVNLEGYNSTQPFITSDGKYLLFSSDRPGGLGKYDLWYASLDTGFHVLSVSNLGDRINSPGDDASPFYHQNSRTLVFASNGRVGMGGFDIYYSKGNFDLSRWDKPKNPGAPLNSTKDDLYFISTDEDNCWNTGWISSDRDSGCCLALYKVREDSRQIISGKIVDCQSHQPLTGAHLSVSDLRHTGKVLTEVFTDSLGQYRFELTNTSRFGLRAEKDGYHPGTGEYLVHIETGRDSLDNGALCLQMIPVPTSEDSVRNALKEMSHSSVLGNFPYKKSALPASAFNSLDSLIALMNRHPAIIIQVEGYTDGIGGETYNLKLAQARVDACIRYLVKKGIDPARLRGRSFGKCCPIAPDTIDGRDNPAGRELNRRVEYKLVQ